ncbi:alpha/beta hydrolase fold domain-containing protein [Aromatoleum toluvorans]|uniref:Alpha/beta hydrolase fold domain-containing protein n=1 Tax=Aromatoleum toluvorans TaxID=92002 RepID=A0ABX1Q411_9RHOO|nr:alpha/beta hydrolase [Aromatoleum toluvorans]NMG45537.1 alpha/beta hydrolase fold domain-containing protein [Aromatoleum toluvorans]
MPRSPQSRSATPTLLPHATDSRIDVGLPAPLGVRIYGQRRAGNGLVVPLIVHLHGGAFVSGSLDSGATVARLLADAGAVVVSVDYPLAPANPFPAAVDAAYAALQWAYRKRAKLAGQGARVFVAGEEAGANLTAAAALMARDRHLPPLAGQILISPMLDPCLGTASLRRSNQGPADCPLAAGWCQYLREPAAAEHPYAIPGRSMRLAGLPPTLLLTADDDPLRDEALAYAGRLNEANVPVSASVLPGPTGWPAALQAVAGAEGPWIEEAGTRLAAFLAQACHREATDPEPNDFPLRKGC